MSRRDQPPIPVVLTLPAEPPTPAEVDAILQAADEIVGRGGRSGLALVLKGSASQKVREQGWDRSPAYGALSHHTVDEITTKVDWCIHHRWLHIEYERGIPLLYFTEKGWERVKALWVQRLLEQFAAWQTAGALQQLWSQMEHMHREIKLLRLTVIAHGGRRDLVPALQAWKAHEVKKVRQAINETLGVLGPVIDATTIPGMAADGASRSDSGK